MEMKYAKQVLEILKTKPLTYNPNIKPKDVHEIFFIDEPYLCVESIHKSVNDEEYSHTIFTFLVTDHQLTLFQNHRHQLVGIIMDKILHERNVVLRLVKFDFYKDSTNNITTFGIEFVEGREL